MSILYSKEVNEMKVKIQKKKQNSSRNRQGFKRKRRNDIGRARVKSNNSNHNPL